MDFDKNFDVERFERYYSGEMSTEEGLEMEKELSSDPLMRENYQAFVDTMDALAHESLKKKIAANPEFREAIRRGSKNVGDNKPTRWGVVALFVLLLVALSVFAYLLFFQSDDQKPAGDEELLHQDIAALNIESSQRHAIVRDFIDNAQIPDSRLRGYESAPAPDEFLDDINTCRQLILETQYEEAMNCIDDLPAQNDESRWLYALALFGNDDLEKAVDRMEDIRSDRTSRFFPSAGQLLDSLYDH